MNITKNLKISSIFMTSVLVSTVRYEYFWIDRIIWLGISASL